MASRYELNPKRQFVILRRSMLMPSRPPDAVDTIKAARRGLYAPRVWYGWNGAPKNSAGMAAIHGKGIVRIKKAISGGRASRPLYSDSECVAAFMVVILVHPVRFVNQL